MLAVGSAIEAIYDKARFLKLQFDKKGRRDAGTPRVDALRIASALCELPDPVSEAAVVGQAVEKVVILLPHEELISINRIGCRCAEIIVRNG